MFYLLFFLFLSDLILYKLKTKPNYFFMARKQFLPRHQLPCRVRYKKAWPACLGEIKHKQNFVKFLILKLFLWQLLSSSIGQWSIFKKNTFESRRRRSKRVWKIKIHSFLIFGQKLAICYIFDELLLLNEETRELVEHVQH